MKKTHQFSPFATILFLLAIPSSIPSAHGALLSYNLEWTGNGGYSASGTFTFDSATAPAIVDATDLQDFSISFFDPGHVSLGTFPQVTGDTIQYPFLDFSFDKAAESMVSGSHLDVGRDIPSPGDYFLEGTVGGVFNFKDSSLNTLDSGGNVSVSPVPEPGMAVVGTGLALSAFALWRRSRRSAQK